jgi:hypothetical protein
MFPKIVIQLYYPDLVSVSIVLIQPRQFTPIKVMVKHKFELSTIPWFLCSATSARTDWLLRPPGPQQCYPLALAPQSVHR